jgi:hypothetical protein
LDKVLISKYGKKSSKNQTSKLNHPIQLINWQMNRKFSKDKAQTANEETRKCSIHMAIKEMQIITTLRFHLTPVTMLSLRNKQQQMLVRMQGKRNTLHCWWEYKLM